ncbi:MAG: GlsB/YeaQ/YmgE family stress response membrane protein [Candidatus Dojkabacteria bacterium]
MSLLLWIIVGGVAGWLASVILGANERMGIFANIIVGMIGSLIGGIIVTLISEGELALSTEFTNLSIASLLVSLLGAIILIGIIRGVRKASH